MLYIGKQQTYEKNQELPNIVFVSDWKYLIPGPRDDLSSFEINIIRID